MAIFDRIAVRTISDLLKDPSASLLKATLNPPSIGENSLSPVEDKEYRDLIISNLPCEQEKPPRILELHLQGKKKRRSV
jgi:hypothetical protein